MKIMSILLWLRLPYISDIYRHQIVKIILKFLHTGHIGPTCQEYKVSERLDNLMLRYMIKVAPAQTFLDLWYFLIWKFWKFSNIEYSKLYHINDTYSNRVSKIHKSHKACMSNVQSKKIHPQNTSIMSTPPTRVPERVWP